MAGMAMKVDDNFREQVKTVLIEFGLLENEPEMTREEAIKELEAFLEKGRNSPISPLSHDEIFDTLIERAKARKGV